MKYNRSDFPSDFLFGVASSGGQDFELVQRTGFDCCSFQIDWTRVLPDGRGAVNEAGLDVYDRLADTMLAGGIRPCATLHNGELPAVLMDMGGWRNRDVAGWFADFTDLVMSRIGDRIFSVAPISLPSHAVGAHSGKSPAPGQQDTRTATRTMHHMMLAHGNAINAMRGLGMTNLGAEIGNPINDNRPLWDCIFKKAYPDTLLKRLEPHLPVGWQDDLGIIGAALDWCALGYTVQDQVKPADLECVQQDYTRDLPVYVFDNRTANSLHLQHDDWTRDVDLHLTAVHDALEKGVPITGYFARAVPDIDKAGPHNFAPMLKTVLAGGSVSLPLAQPVGAMHAHWNLVADIGGTNTRLGVVTDGKVTDLRKFPTGTLPELLEAFQILRDEIGTNPRAVVAAGAGPVKDGTISLTNAKLDLSEADIGKATGAQHTFVVNDFTAAAWSVAEITGDDVEVLQGAPTPPQGTRLVVGPGTGLGVGALVFSEGRYHTASGEGGHVGLAPRREDEVEIFRAARHIAPECFFDDTLVLEAEMFLSGTGLPILYKATGIAAGHPNTPMRSAKDILQDARMQTDPIAEKAAHMFTTHLGAVMGDLAVALMPTGGVFLVGGVAEKNRWLFKDTFREAFNAGGRFTGLRRSMNLYVSEQDEFGIVGANNFCKSALER
ncbi:family 1 glycosylhydrolase [Ruegeria profundi]|uniref:family 1 glycosylhydrolase n=1 Tax=Ruegeria profundi TaxID=1685378 RepID=UPI001CD38A86|nr:family 1 glycosylhydrolase [Ruegeria profundi]MCA0928375.1 ROK family protein [Ruegeria profundi]